MSFIQDFKKFMLKGDIIALATAVVIGAAFNKIIASVVADVIMPIIGLITGGIFLGILLEIFMPGTIDSMNDIALSLLCIPFGLLACFGLYWIFKYAWQGDEIIETNDFPAENLE